MKKRRKQMSEINVVPYIDVMLVLLVIFMITAPLLTQGVKVNLPKAKARALSRRQEPVIVSVDRLGRYYLNISKNPSVSMPAKKIASIISKLDIAESKNGKREILIKGDKDVNYGKVVQVMVLLKNAGVSNVGLMTQDYSR